MSNSNIEVKIVNILNSEKENAGTGFYISENLIVSCYHVLTDGYALDIEKVYYKKSGMTDVLCAYLSFYDEEKDIVLLKSEECSEDYFEVERYECKDGQICNSYGFPRSGAIDTWSKRMIYVGRNQNTSLYQLDNANNITNGFSGAPVWDEEEKLIGIINANVHSEDCRALNEAFMTGVNDLYSILEQYYADREDKKYESIYEKVMKFDELNHVIYTSLISKLRDKEVIVPLVGGSLTEYAFGRKKSVIDKLCKTLFPTENSELEKMIKNDLMLGEVGIAAWACMEENKSYRNFMINFFKNIYNSCTVSEFQTEEEAVALIPYMQYAIRFMPDGILEKVAERRNIITTLTGTNESKEMGNQRRGLEIYSLCGDLERNVLYSLKSDSHNGEIIYERFSNWLGMNHILYVGVEFEGKTLELCNKLVSQRGNHFALVSCKDNEEDKKSKRRLLESLGIDGILYDENEYAAVECVLHKVLVDIQNERFERRFSKLDFRFSQHCLCGREEEVRTLESFLDSDDDVKNGLPFLWMQICGTVGSGKSKLVYDFAKERAKDWRLIWVDCNHNEEFLKKIEDFADHLEKEWRNVLVVFDDFYLHPFSFDECEALLVKRNKCKLRLLFVHDRAEMIFHNDDVDRQKHYKVTKYYKSPLLISPLDKKTVVNICKEYAIYLSNSSVDSIYENDIRDRMYTLEELIGEVYEECMKEKEVLVLYVCLLRTLKWLGLTDEEDSVQDNRESIIYYMTRKKFVSDLEKDENRINMSKYLSRTEERNRNREKPNLGDVNMYIPEI